MNKKIIMMLLALSSTVALKAQTQKGDQLLGGALGVSTGKSTIEYANTANNANFGYTNKNTSFSIGPNYSFFVANNLDLGAGIGYSYQKNNMSNVNMNSYNPDKTTAQGFSATVYLRKYFLYDNKIGIRTGPYASFERDRTTYEFTTSNTPYTGPQSQTLASGGIGLDFVYFPYKKVGLAASIGSLSYTHNDAKQPQSGYSTRSNSVGFNFASGVNFSVFFAFGK
jgi:hypothetical protein